MPYSDQASNGVTITQPNGTGDSTKSSAVHDKSLLKPLDLKDVSPSQEQDPNFSYEKDKSAVEVKSVVEKFLKPAEGNIVQEKAVRSTQEANPLFNDLSHAIFTEDVIRKRKSTISENLDKQIDLTVNGQKSVIPEMDNSQKAPILDVKGRESSTPEMNGQKSTSSSDVNGRRSLTPEVNLRKTSITELNGQTTIVHDINGHKVDSNDRSSNNLENTDVTAKSSSSADTQRDQGDDYKLLQWEDMPRHLQFNPYVKTGYRPLLSAWGCIHSLFYLHNETVNILTHGLPIIYIIYVVPKLLPWESEAGFPFLAWCHLAGALAPWCGSFLYHLFMNTSRGAQAYNRLLQLDMLGIWVSQSFGALPMMAATTYCMPWLARWTIITAYCLLSIWGLYKAMTAWSPWERRLCFLLPFTMRAILAWFRAGGMAGGNPEAIHHIILQDAVSAIGGVIGAINIPERWFPGTVDMYLNSHNIMHVLVVTAVYFMHKATVLDIRWMSEVQCQGEDVSSGHAGDILPGVVYQL